MVNEKADSCLSCQAATTGKAKRLEPLQMTPPPSAPWKELSMDRQVVYVTLIRCIQSSSARRGEM